MLHAVEVTLWKFEGSFPSVPIATIELSFSLSSCSCNFLFPGRRDCHGCMYPMSAAPLHPSHGSFPCLNLQEGAESEPMSSFVSVSCLNLQEGAESKPKQMNPTSFTWVGPNRRRIKSDRTERETDRARPSHFYMRNLLGWLETRLSQITLN